MNLSEHLIAIKQSPKPFMIELSKGLALTAALYISVFIYGSNQVHNVTQSIQEKIPQHRLELTVTDTQDKVIANEPAQVPQQNAPEVEDTHPTQPPEHVVDINQNVDIPPQENQQTNIDITTLYEETEYGLLPKRIESKEQITVYEAFKKQVDKNIYKRPIISLVLIRPEKSEDTTKNALDILPRATTVFISSYDNKRKQLKALLDQRGNETWLKLNVTSKNLLREDTGPNALSSAISTDENKNRLAALISTLDKYTGLAITHPETNLTKNRYEFKSILKEIDSYGLGFVLNSDINNVRDIETFATEQEIPFAAANITIDEEPTANKIQINLKKLEELAAKDGYAIGFIEGYPNSIEIIAQWAQTISEQDINFVPLSAITNKTVKSTMKRLLSDTESSN